MSWRRAPTHLHRCYCFSPLLTLARNACVCLRCSAPQSCAVPRTPSPLPPTHTHRFVHPSRRRSLAGRLRWGNVVGGGDDGLEQPTASGAAWEMALLTGPLWAAALLDLPNRPLQCLRQGSLHPLSVLADLLQFPTG
jgi:hypothetical protein